MWAFYIEKLYDEPADKDAFRAAACLKSEANFKYQSGEATLLSVGQSGIPIEFDFGRDAFMGTPDSETMIEHEIVGKSLIDIAVRPKVIETEFPRENFFITIEADPCSIEQFNIEGKFEIERINETTVFKKEQQFLNFDGSKTIIEISKTIVCVADEVPLILRVNHSSENGHFKGEVQGCNLPKAEGILSLISGQKFAEFQFTEGVPNSV